MSGESRADIESAAVRLLAVREHARAEVVRKLAAKGYDPAGIESVVDDLVRRRLLSDERFAEQYVSQRVRKGYGPLRIRAELRERGVDAGVVSSCLADGRYEWASLLQDLQARRFGSRPPGEPRELARQARFLAGRGFPERLVRRLLFDR